MITLLQIKTVIQLYQSFSQHLPFWSINSNRIERNQKDSMNPWVSNRFNLHRNYLDTHPYIRRFILSFAFNILRNRIESRLILIALQLNDPILFDFQ